MAASLHPNSSIVRLIAHLPVSSNQELVAAPGSTVSDEGLKHSIPMRRLPGLSEFHIESIQLRKRQLAEAPKSNSVSE
jgi:hypothetical protein